MLELDFRQTCFACPEQYDVFDDNHNYIAYVRLRHGCFRVDNADRTITYFSRVFPITDLSDIALEPEEIVLLRECGFIDPDGIFETESTRQAYLAIAKRKILEGNN